VARYSTGASWLCMLYTCLIYICTHYRHPQVLGVLAIMMSGCDGSSLCTHTHTQKTHLCKSCSACDANRTSANMCCDTYLAIMMSGCDGSSAFLPSSYLPLMDSLAAQGSCSRDSSCYSLCPEGQYFDRGVCRGYVCVYMCVYMCVYVYL
jgi:hypothetical protein